MKLIYFCDACKQELLAVFKLVTAGQDLKLNRIARELHRMECQL